MISLLPLVDGKYIVFGNNKIYSKAVYAYGAVKHNLITPEGSGGGAESVPLTYKKKLGRIGESIEENNCEELNEVLDYFEVRNIVASSEKCEEIRVCGLKEKVKKKHFCLFER